MPALYRRLLGAAFDTLPPSLQDFHDVTSEWIGHADFNITRAPGWLRNFVANRGGLPRAGTDVPVRLRRVAEGDAERWVREIGGQRLESVQRAWHGLLVENFGALSLGFRLVVEAGVLRLLPVRTWVLGIPLPYWLGPHGDGREEGVADGCQIVARAFAPLLGQLVQYAGLVRKGERLEAR